MKCSTERSFNSLLKWWNLWSLSRAALEDVCRWVISLHGYPSGAMGAVLILRNFCCSQVRNTLVLVYCIRSCHAGSGSPCGLTLRTGCCCHSMVNFQWSLVPFGTFSAACWDTHSALTWMSCGLYSGTSQTKKRQGWRSPAVCIPQSARSSRIWFPFVMNVLHLEESLAPPWAPGGGMSYQSVWCSDFVALLSHNNWPRAAKSPFPLTSIHRIPLCLFGPLLPACHQSLDRESAQHPFYTPIVFQPG